MAKKNNTTEMSGAQELYNFRKTLEMLSKL